MTTLLELKQKAKEFYGRHETFVLPVFKFVLSLLLFLWINSSLGFMTQLDNIFIVLVLAILCSVIPINLTIVVGLVLVVIQCYGIGIEVAGFAFALTILLGILFLRFTSSANQTMLFVPLGFAAQVPALVPITAGLLSTPLSAVPAGCGVVLYYFVQLIKAQASVLQSADTDAGTRIKILLDGLINNLDMWVTLVAFVAVILLVYVLRTREQDYAWRIAILLGGVAYVFIKLIGGLLLEVSTSLLAILLTTVISVAVAYLVEFFAFGADYSRAERLNFEDDEYYYYVKAVPKIYVATPDRQIRKINAAPLQEDELEEMQETETAEYANPIFNEDEDAFQSDAPTADLPDVSRTLEENVDFEKKLEESLKDL
ncbi:MAG: hypothetical protein ACK5MN_08125 [Lachnospiraceae bacterium]